MYAAEWAEFSYVRDNAELSDSALSKQLSTLSTKGYFDIKKGHVGKRPRTWVNITDLGRQALVRHAAALQTIIDNANPLTTGPPSA